MPYANPSHRLDMPSATPSQMSERALPCVRPSTNGARKQGAKSDIALLRKTKEDALTKGASNYQVDETAQAFIAKARALLIGEYLPKIEHCLERLRDEEVWWRAG